MRKTLLGIAALVATASLMFWSVNSASAQRRGGGGGWGGRGGSGFSVYTPGGVGFSYGRGGYYGPGYGYGSGYYGSGYGRGWGYGSGYYGDAYVPGYSSYYYDTPSYGAAPDMGSYGPAYGSASGATTPSGSLNLEDHVPAADAKIWVNGQASTQRGTTRFFTVNEILPGRPYRYEVRAEWMEDGRPMSQTRTVTAQTGETAQVVFSRGAATGVGTDLELRDRDRGIDVRDRDVKDRDLRDRETRDRELRDRELRDRELRDRELRDRDRAPEPIPPAKVKTPMPPPRD